MIDTGIVVTIEMGIEVPKKGGGVYPGSRLTYRDSTGTIRQQAFHQNTFKFNKALQTQLSNLSSGDSIEINKEKDGEFWKILSVNKVSAGSSNATTTIMQPASKVPASPSPRSNYETPEERAQRQVYIIRQSSLATAVNFYNHDGFKKAAPDPETIVAIAKEFEKYVMGVGFEEPKQDFTGLEDDTDGIV